MKELNSFSDIENTPFHGFILELTGKEAKFSAATSCQMLCRNEIGGVHPFPHGQSSLQKLSPITYTTKLHDSAPGIPDGRRLPGDHGVWCASPPLLVECQSSLCLTRHLQARKQLSAWVSGQEICLTPYL